MCHIDCGYHLSIQLKSIIDTNNVYIVKIKLNKKVIFNGT